MSEEDYTYLFKIVIVGDSGVGKSNIFSRFIHDEFHQDSKATIGVEFSAKNVSVKDKIIKTQVWDTAGQERFRALAKSYYRGAVGALIVYDITNYDSLQNAKRWLKEVKDYADPKLVSLLIGNKSDLADKRAVKIEESTQYAESEGLGFVETSAKDNINIDEIFARLVTEIVEKMEKIDIEEKKEKPEKKSPSKKETSSPVLTYGAAESIKITEQRKGGSAANNPGCTC